MPELEMYFVCIIKNRVLAGRGFERLSDWHRWIEREDYSVCSEIVRREIVQGAIQ